MPLWSAAIAIGFLGEKMTVPIAAGTLLVVAGIVLISWRADQTVKDFKWWYVAAPLLAAILGGIVGIVGLLCVCIYLALPTTKEKLVWNRESLGYFSAGGALESLGLLLVLYALSFGPVILITPLTATLPLWVVLGGKIFLRDVEEITRRIILDALLVVAGTIFMGLAKT